ncbi:TrbI/VirB10 family protein [uncultured Croceicoccus sp.]|jgi:conjugal transfer pilus assembly protein TraB|uniref:TrbI/VirB10 family protein n=1 Tax=uncultured Croceicoccus sp. TaxID=1295329 RepID=UPI002612CE7B|nr:TrbI/VirB10 family protein [uncultured Croceicoccus sp.]
MTDATKPQTSAPNANATKVPSASAPGKTAAASNINERTQRRQKMLFASIGAVALLGGSWIIFGGEDGSSTDTDGARTIETAGLVNRDLANREFVSVFDNRVGNVEQQQKKLAESQLPRSELEAQLQAIRAENEMMRADGEAAIDAISAENAELKTRLAAAETTAAATPPPPAYGPQAGGYDARGLGSPAGPSQSGAATGLDGNAPSGVRLLNFTSDKSAAGASVRRAEAPPLVIEDSPEYLPPNSYAPARVIVGVDASAGVASQTDPLPVVLRITGPARSVLQDGRVLTTRIEGCVVNGAARGDLSSEKVYVKLARMTCDQPGGRVAVSEVKGFIAFAGKSGVRGRIVSREGSLISQALLAGIVGGFGRGFSANANSVFSGITANSDGTRSKLSGTDILAGGLGQGAGDAADTVSKYLIERAEQYQPVVEMPTGIEVEIVFLDGAFVRNAQ